MNYWYLVITLIAAYLTGSVPTAVWAGRLFHGVDVRQHGSGNAGATNTIRVLGWQTGVPVLIVDVAKGWLASSIPVWVFRGGLSTETLMNLQILPGLTAIAGHVFPVWAGFRGGKGVATTFGVLLALSPSTPLVCLGIFISVLLLSGYVSLSSIIAGIAFPAMVLAVFGTTSKLFGFFSVLVAVTLLVTHRKNIYRLSKGEEKKFSLRKRAEN